MALMDLLPNRRVVTTEAPPEPPPPPPAAHKGRLFIGGRYPLYWDTSDPASVEACRAAFQSAICSGYTGQSYKTRTNAWGGSSMDGEITRSFDPEADEVRMSLPYAGG